MQWNSSANFYITTTDAIQGRLDQLEIAGVITQPSRCGTRRSVIRRCCDASSRISTHIMRSGRIVAIATNGRRTMHGFGSANSVARCAVFLS